MYSGSQLFLPPRGGKNEERSGGNDLILLNTFNFDGVLQQVWAPGGYPGFKIRAQAHLSTEKWKPLKGKIALTRVIFSLLTERVETSLPFRKQMTSGYVHAAHSKSIWASVNEKCSFQRRAPLHQGRARGETSSKGCAPSSLFKLT